MKKADLSGRVVLLTGAGSGFGRAMAVAFCAAGARVFGVGRRAGRLHETAALAGGSFMPLPWDIRETARAAELVGRVVGEAGRVDVLVNDAAILVDDDVPLSELDWSRWEDTWRTNVSGGLALTQAAFAPMRKQRHGRVAFVSSGLGFFPMLEYGSYCISKAAVNMMVRVFALDGAGDNILVNAIDPGVARTEMNRTASESPETVNTVALFLASLPEGGPTGKCFNKRLRENEW